MNKALEQPVSNLLKQIKESPNVNMDETGHRRDGMWGVMSHEAAFFSVEKSRGKKIIIQLMGDYNQILTSDRYAAYNYFDSDKRQTWVFIEIMKFFS